MYVVKPLAGWPCYRCFRVTSASGECACGINQVVEPAPSKKMTKNELTENGLYWYLEPDRDEWTIVGVELAVAPCERRTSSVDWMGSDMTSYFHELPDNATFIGPLQEPE